VTRSLPGDEMLGSKERHGQTPSESRREGKKMDARKVRNEGIV
jgi:hypothetical protein